MDIETNSEVWQVDAGGKTFDTTFEEMKVWIAEGSLLRIDRVRKGNLRWIEAGKVPVLVEFFNAKDAAAPSGPVITTTKTEVLGIVEPTQAFTNKTGADPIHGIRVCSVHGEAAAAYECNTCSNLFCKGCPSAYGGNVRICPFCGAMCSPVAKADTARRETVIRRRASDRNFGFSDFGNAFAHPLRFKTSLILGALIFAFVSVGQVAISFGGIIMMAASIFCFLLANMLTFGVLTNTVENFSQGKLEENFMPSFDDFSLWDDVVHPFFLMIGVHISSFGPLIAVGLVAIFMVMGAVTNEKAFTASDAARIIGPSIHHTANSVNESDRAGEILNTNLEKQRRRVEAIETGEVPYDEAVTKGSTGDTDQFSSDEERDFAVMQRLLANQRKAQLEATIGKTPETKAKEQAAYISKILSYGIVFIILGGITLLWGLFYYPAACAVAGYTRSFSATLNPSVGLDTIRRLGVDYLKILAMGLLILLMSGTVGGVLSGVFGAFDLPAVGNLPATFIGSLASFYFFVVFSCVIGYALFKAADRLELPSA